MELPKVGPSLPAPTLVEWGRRARKGRGTEGGGVGATRLLGLVFPSGDTFIYAVEAKRKTGGTNDNAALSLSLSLSLRAHASLACGGRVDGVLSSAACGNGATTAPGVSFSAEGAETSDGELVASYSFYLSVCLFVCLSLLLSF